jgi:hypothetical protein
MPRELMMDPVQKQGGSSSSQNLVLHCFIHKKIIQCIGGRMAWLKSLVT